MTETFRSAGSLSRTGLLFDVGPDLRLALTNDGSMVPARSCSIQLRSIKPPTTSAHSSATVDLELGRSIGGAKIHRRFTLTPRGVWLSVVGWSSCKAKVEAMPGGGELEVSYAFLEAPCPSEFPLMLVDQVTAGTAAPVPDGAARLGVGTADAGWLWRTQVGTGPVLDLAAPQLADGQQRPVMGAWYVPTVDSVVAWELQQL